MDSSLIDKKVERDDVTVYYVPSTSLADENGVSGLSNMILIGKLFKEVLSDGDYQFCDADILDQAVQKCIPRPQGPDAGLQPQGHPDRPGAVNRTT